MRVSYWGGLGIGMTFIVGSVPLILTGWQAAGWVMFVCGVAIAIASVSTTQQPSDDPRLVLEGHFSFDPNDTEPQGMFVRNFGGPARDVRVQPFGMKGSDVTFDEIPLLLTTDPPRPIIARGQGDRKSIWEAAGFIEMAKRRPIFRLSKSVLGNMKLTGLWPRRGDTHRMPLRIKYRDANGRDHSNGEFYLQFVSSSGRAPI